MLSSFYQKEPVNISEETVFGLMQKPNGYISFLVNQSYAHISQLKILLILKNMLNLLCQKDECLYLLSSVLVFYGLKM